MNLEKGGITNPLLTAMFPVLLLLKIVTQLPGYLGGISETIPWVADWANTWRAKSLWKLVGKSFWHPRKQRQIQGKFGIFSSCFQGSGRFQKNPRAHKNKIGTSPPPPNPPLKRRNFTDMVFPAERTHFFQVSIKSAQPFPAPELRTRILRTLRGFFWRFKKGGNRKGGVFAFCLPAHCLSAPADRQPYCHINAASVSLLKSGKEKTNKYKQICGIVPGLGGYQKVVYAFFRVIPYGREKHINKIPPKSRDNPVKFLFTCFFSLCVCFAPK